ncbi:hypothetical protein AMJ87_03915 [candidate division WOR_3 bacterium SM23_60]|uniref:Secretion system C-terminal sorting domain-containing protein n=1 Tax=candidate division WOR_3 bacterium SM23_60 TaxID=1703780 RepID=A0A0S8GLJ4_UNCW3|nr:MAG: hypothetical protein AMJ87_03915 [candidate division WOR_3 bacterium SM23_60]
MKSISRREFLKYLGAGAISIVAKPKIPLSLRNRLLPASTVVQCFDENATSGSSINESVVHIMVDESIKTLTGLSDVGEAWKSLFPGITASSIIGIKVNCINHYVPTHPPVANTIANGLAQIHWGTTYFPKNNIIIWDRTSSELSSAGYTLYNGGDPGTVRCYGTNGSYDTGCPFNVNGVTSYPSTILSQNCDYIIDAAVLKDHNGATATLTLKNHYGSVNNPSSLHGGTYSCNPFIPSLNQQIRDIITPNNIQKISIIDGLFGRICWGPSGSANCNPKKIIMSLDTVACDSQGQNIINEERIALGQPTIDAPHIATAAQPPYNLGTTDIHLIEINNPTSIEESRQERLVNGMFTITPNPIHQTAVITVTLTQASAVYLDVIDASGRMCQHVFKGNLRSGTHRISFNRTPTLSTGTYFVRMRNHGTSSTKKVTILN